MSYDQYIALISGGTVLGMFDQAWDFGTATAALQDAKMYDRTYVALGLIYSEEDLEGIALPTEGADAAFGIGARLGIEYEAYFAAPCLGDDIF